MRGGSLKLKDLSHFVPSKGEQKAHLAKVTRLIAEQNFDHPLMGKIIWDLCKYHCPDKVTIAIDRTNWQYGKVDINYLVASVVIGMISVPLVWTLVDSAGNSDTSMRMGLVQTLLRIVPVDRIGAIVADREFIGKDWFQFLTDQGLPFTIRLKNNTQVTLENGDLRTVSEALCLPKKGTVKSAQVILWGQNIRITGSRGKKRKNGEIDEIILASNQGLGADALALYRTRWACERTFKCLKSDGFDFERTHITRPDRLLKLFAIAAFGIVLRVISGAFRALERPIKIKNHGRKAWSLFTYGLDYLSFLFKKMPFFEPLSLVFGLKPSPPSTEPA